MLAHPGKLRVIAEARIKTDKIDAEMLARLLRADLIPAAHAPTKEVRAVKRGLRQRLFLVRVQTMVKNRIGALRSRHTVQRRAVADLYGKEGLAWLRGLTLPNPDGRVLAEDLKLLEVLRDQIAATNGL
jgi:transposase